MKPDWDSLMDDYKDSKTALIADVDCTAEGKSLCEKHDVRGYPSIKYGDPDDLKEYNGGRTLVDFKKFADENLGPNCGPDNLDLCDDAMKKMIAKFQKMDVDEVDMAIEEGDAKVAGIEAKSKKTVDGLGAQVSGLQDKISKENKKKDAAIAKLTKKSGLKMMKACAASKKAKDDL
jgi:hypothetical protein